MKLGLGLGLSNQKINIGGFDAATQGLLTLATSEGDTPASGDVLTALDTLITTLKSAGIFAKLDLLYVFATNGDRNFAKYNIISPGTYDCTEGVAPTFTSLQGFAGNGTTMYLNTNWNPNTNGVNYTQDDASIGVWKYTNPIEAKHVLGALDTSGGGRIASIWNRGTQANFWAVNSGNNTKSITALSGTGLQWIDRPSSSTEILYSGETIHESSAIASTAIPSFPIFILARNDDGTPSFHSSSEVSVFFAGSSLGSLKTELNDAISTYMASI